MKRGFCNVIGRLYSMIFFLAVSLVFVMVGCEESGGESGADTDTATDTATATDTDTDSEASSGEDVEYSADDGSAEETMGINTTSVLWWGLGLTADGTTNIHAVGN